MNKLIKQIKSLKNGNIKNIINKRTDEFKNIGKDNNKIFKELCFCILTANSTAERCISVQEKIGDGFIQLPKKKLVKNLRDASCRFYNVRSEYIMEARKHKDRLTEVINSKMPESEKRERLANNIKGIGYKEASHFLRNIGYENLAIIDFHIIDLLTKHKIIKKPKIISKKIYLEIENKLKKISEKLKITLAELDLYLWYLETGKVLK